MAIRKGTVTFTFLFDDEIDTVEYVEQVGLDGILANCDDGHMVGQASSITYEVVEPQNVEREELALGCDGTFFERDESEEGEDE